MRFLKHTDAASPMNIGEQNDLPASASTQIHITENDLRQVLRRIYIRTDNLILELKREKYRSLGVNQNVYMLIDDLIWRLEDILSLCEHTGRSQ